MRKTVLGLALIVAAVVLPTAASEAQSTGATSCAQGELIEGRCLSVDGQDSICNGTACVEFVEESTLICPGTSIETSPLACTLTEPADQSEQTCPDGARGEISPGCYIFVPKEPSGCPATAFTDADGHCRRPVSPAAGYYSCSNPDAQLVINTASQDCVSTPDPIPSPCPAATARFDNACWNMNGLTPPQSCAAHGVSGVTKLASGLCRVPLAIETGPAACEVGTSYLLRPAYVLFNRNDDVQVDGPPVAGCVAVSASIGISVRACFFPGDDLDWGDYGDPGLCTRFDTPVTALCPAGYSPADFAGGVCLRLEVPVDDACTDGSEPQSIPGGLWCVLEADFATFTCPAGTERLVDNTVCVAYRPWQGAVLCGGTALLIVTSELQYGCWPLVGSQPDVCNGLGTLGNCFELREPATSTCPTAAGCVMLEAAPALACDGRAVTIDMNVNGGDGMGTSDADVILGTPGDDAIFGLGGDDVVCAGAGVDMISGGDGADTIFGGPGDDQIDGGNQADTINGGDGDDHIGGSYGWDRISAGPGNDFVSAGFGNDWVWAGPGIDDISGGPGDDLLLGFDGDDMINAGGGNDKMNGMNGNDVISGGDGADQIWGGLGDDDIDAGSGFDWIWGFWGSDTIDGGFGNDSIFGQGNNDILHGGPGNDLIDGDFGDDEINGDGGNDTLIGGDRNDVMNGGPGNDSLDGGFGIDTCDGSAGTDTASNCEAPANIP